MKRIFGGAIFAVVIGGLFVAHGITLGWIQATLIWLIGLALAALLLLSINLMVD